MYGAEPKKGSHPEFAKKNISLKNNLMQNIKPIYYFKNAKYEIQLKNTNTLIQKLYYKMFKMSFVVLWISEEYKRDKI